MRKPDVEVREVLCSETGKPMPKIPLWMADIKVKFLSDEARQRHPSMPSIADIEPVRRSNSIVGEIDDIKALGVITDIEEDEPDLDIEDIEAEADLEEVIEEPEV